jgi:hypothetical protein
MSKWVCANGHVSELDDSQVKAQRFACTRPVAMKDGGRCGKPLERVMSEDAQAIYDRYEARALPINLDGSIPRETRDLPLETRHFFPDTTAIIHRILLAGTEQPTLRDLFAMAVLSGADAVNPHDRARYAYAVADAMMSERKP